VQLTLLPGRPRPAEELQRALEGRLPARSTSASVGGYAEVAGRLSELVPTTLLRPSQEYRAELHERLVELAVARAATLSPAAPEASTANTQRSQTETERRRTAWWGWFDVRWRRTLGAATGALLALCVGVGFASAGAVPGGLLYPVKQLIQSAQVQLAHGDLSRGQTLLDQADGHIDDASTLVSRGSPDPADVATALNAAHSDVAEAQQTLLAYFNRSHDPAALSALATFANEQSTALTTLRGRVPVVSEPLVDRLLAQLGGVATTVRTVAAQCGSPCASVPVSTLPGPDGLPATAGLTSGGPGSSGSALGTPLGAGGLGGLAGLGGLGGTGGSSSGTGAGSGPVSAGSGGVGVNLPGLGATVPAPGVGVGSGGAQVTVPPVHVSAGPVTASLPGVGISLPPVLPPHSSSHSTAASSSSSSVCVLVICVG
jgi:Domain of unknown function (DUF5667)